MKEKVGCKKMLVPKPKSQSIVGKRHKDSSKAIPRVTQKSLPSPVDAEHKNTDLSHCSEITIIEPSATQASPIWPNDGILRQALMSFSYSDEQIEKHQEDTNQSITEPMSDIAIDAVQVIDLTPVTIPIDTVKMIAVSHNLQMSNTITSFTTSLPGMSIHSSPNISQDTVCLSSDESLGLDNSLQNATSASGFHTAAEESFVSLPVVILPLDHLVTSSLSNSILSPISDANSKFLALPTTQLSDASRLLPPTNSMSPLTSRQNTTSRSKEEFLTAVYSATDIEASIKSQNGRRDQPLPPMSDLKVKRQAATPLLKPTTRYIDEIITIHDSPSSSPTPVMAESRSLQKSTLREELTNIVDPSPIHLRPDFAQDNSPSTLTSNADRRKQKSIQEILDSQSTGTTYTTSYCSPIMAVQNSANGGDLFSTAATLTPKANSQLHALLHGTVSNSTPMTMLSLQLLLNNSAAPAGGGGSVPSGSSLGALLGSAPSSFFASRPAANFAAADSLAYPCEILSQLKNSGVLPAMSSSQVSSVLSALDSDSHHDPGTQLAPCSPAADKVSTLTQTDDSQTHDKSKDSADETMIVDVLNLLGSDSVDKPSETTLKSSLKRETRTNVAPMLFVKQDMHESPGQRNLRFRNDLQRTANGVDSARQLETNTPCSEGGNFAQITNADERPADFRSSASSFVEEVSCFKCKFCPFLSMDKDDIASHINREHSSELPATEKRQKLKCPGCSNVFYSPTSLKVHLAQDHQVVGEGLNMMVDIVVSNSEKEKMTISKYKKKKATQSKNLSVLPRGESVGIEVEGMSGIESDGMQPSHAAMTSPSREVVKIRVRKLAKQPDDAEMPQRCHIENDAEMQRCHNELDDEMQRCHDENDDAVDSFGTEPLHIDEDATCAASEHDGERGGGGNDDDASVEPLKPTAYNADVKLPEVKSDLTELLACPPTGPLDDSPPGLGAGQGAEEVGEGEPAVVRKRGRPRGSRNQPLPPLQQSEDPVENYMGYKCDMDGCAVRLQSHDNIEYHRRCHAGASFVCPECAQQTGHWSALLAHLWRVHAIDMGLYACELCAYKTTSYCKLVNIHKRIHSEERPFLCDTCGKGFKNPKQMRNHKVIHNSLRVKSDSEGVSLGSCDVCGRTFMSTRLLRLHQDNVHRKLRPHLCNFCGYSASSRSTLKMHMRQHTGEKPFRCDECEYRTADHNSLRRHKMRHTGDKPYKCPHCTYACIQSSTFKAHLKSKHPGLDKGLMFSCQLCSFRSVKKDNLVAHLAEHEGGGGFVPPPRHPRVKAGPHHPRANLQPPGQSRDVAVEVSQPADMSAVGDNIHLIYVNGDAVTGGTHSLSELMPVGRDDSTDAQITDFEPEEITGDIRELSQIAEPGELKFKVLQEHQ